MAFDHGNDIIRNDRFEFLGHLWNGKSEEKMSSLLYSRDASVLGATGVGSEQFLPVNASVQLHL